MEAQWSPPDAFSLIECLSREPLKVSTLSSQALSTSTSCAFQLVPQERQRSQGAVPKATRQGLAALHAEQGPAGFDT